MEKIDLEKAHSYFKRQLLDLSDYFGDEKYPDEIAAVKTALAVIEKVQEMEKRCAETTCDGCEHWDKDIVMTGETTRGNDFCSYATAKEKEVST